MEKVYKKYLFDDAIEKIKLTLKRFEDAEYKNNSYQLYLANGDCIKYTIHKNNIPHLLGIDLNKLVNNKIIEKADSYDMLQELLSNSNKYYEKLKSIMIPEELFSNYVNDKIDNFGYQTGIPYPNQNYFVCKYDRKRAYTIKEIDGLTADYYLAKKNKHGDIILLGLVKENEFDYSNTYAPQTSRVIKNDENFTKNISEILENQVVTYITGLSIIDNIDNPKNYNLNTIEISLALNEMRSLSEITNSIPCTISDHIYNLKNFKNNKEASYETKNILRMISEKIKNGEIISLEEYEIENLDNELIKCFEIYNDTITNNKMSASIDESYTTLKCDRNNLQEKNNQLIEEINDLKKELESIKLTLQNKDEEIKELGNEKEKYEILKEKVKSIAETC